jgi:hypothetical protein
MRGICWLAEDLLDCKKDFAALSYLCIYLFSKFLTLRFTVNYHTAQEMFFFKKDIRNWSCREQI